MDVFGAGPVGLMAAYSCLLRGASQVFSVDHLRLKRIRIGKHPKKLRVVFDLNHPLDKGLRYAIKAMGDQLTVRLSLPARKVHE